MMKVCFCFVYSFLLCITVAGCESQSGEDAQQAAADSLQNVETGGDGEGEEPDYRAVLTGALTDTLEGDARFGKVYEIATQESELIIELQAGSDFTGGLFITLGDSALPRAGTYDLTVPADGDTTQQASPFQIVYHRGLILDLVSVNGTLDLTAVSDTLIQGEFETLMQGEVPIPGAGVQRGEVRARGEFKASPGNVGFVVGLQKHE